MLWKTGALKRAVTRGSVKETGVLQSTLVYNLVPLRYRSNAIIHIARRQSAGLEVRLYAPLLKPKSCNCFRTKSDSNLSHLILVLWGMFYKVLSLAPTLSSFFFLSLCFHTAMYCHVFLFVLMFSPVCLYFFSVCVGYHDSCGSCPIQVMYYTTTVQVETQQIATKSTRHLNLNI